jgi:hypothetical protein
MTAFKDLVISIRHIFDFVLTPTAYALELRGEDSGPRTVDRGDAERFAEKHPRFSGFFWALEAFWKPGVLLGGEARVVSHEAGVTRVETWLTSGARVTWFLDSRTLAVHRGVVSSPDGHRYELAHSRYRWVDGVFVPGKVVFRDSTSRIRIEARLRKVEINPELEGSIFDPLSVGG